MQAYFLKEAIKYSNWWTIYFLVNTAQSTMPVCRIEKFIWKVIF